MHLDFTVSVGQIGIMLVLLGIFVRVNRVIWEHDLMWLDYAKTHGLPVRGARLFGAENGERAMRKATGA